MNLTVGEVISRLQANGHTFLAVEFESAVNNSLKQIAGQKQGETELQQTEEGQPDALDLLFADRGYKFPPNAR